MRRVVLFPFAVLSVVGMCVVGVALALFVLPGVFVSRCLREGEE